MECMVNIWGGAWNYNADPSIETDLGIKEGAHYFQTEEEMDKFINLISNPIYKNQGLMIDPHVGNLTHKRTIFVGTFEYEGKQLELRYDFGYEYDEEHAIFMFTYGNYGCDCNRSRLIRNQHGEHIMPKLGCGWEIELLDYHVEYEE